MKSHENPFSESQVLCGWTDMTKLIASIRDFANVPKIVLNYLMGGTQYEWGPR